MESDRPATIPESRPVALREEPVHLFPGQHSEVFMANMAGTRGRLEAFSRQGSSEIPGNGGASVGNDAESYGRAPSVSGVIGYPVNNRERMDCAAYRAGNL